MNFLAHLWLAEQTGTSLAGAVLGDMVRGSDLSAWPGEIATGIQLHRRIDAATDRHPATTAVRATFPPGARRYAGILLDLACDHVLALDWPAYTDESLDRFSARCGTALAAAAPWFERAGNWTPDAAQFARLLQSYAEPAGIDRAIVRTAQRLKRPEGMLEASGYWPAAAQAIRPALPALLDDIAREGLSRLTAAPTDPAAG